MNSKRATIRLWKNDSKIVAVVIWHCFSAETAILILLKSPYFEEQEDVIKISSAPKYLSPFHLQKWAHIS